MTNRRAFRTKESHEAEEITRRAVVDFLKKRNFSDVINRPEHTGQTIEAVSPAGERLRMRVKLCWRRRGQRASKRLYSATQLIAKVPDHQFERALADRMGRFQAAGITHYLVVQGNGQGIESAALIPIGAMLEIWCKQRGISDELIAAGKLGRRKKNHATNGWSPTLWLRDDEAPEVSDVLWKDPRVLDLVHEGYDPPSESVADDTFDDLPGIDYSNIGSDGAPVIKTVRSEVKRDRKVRDLVLQRAAGNCERCGTARDYEGFLDVHHILGADKGDRVWNCVGICPNCHREAHTSPQRDEINNQLLAIAARSKSGTPSSRAAFAR